MYKLIALLLTATALWAAPQATENGILIHVRDVGIGTSYGLLASDTGFTQIATDTAIRVAFSNESKFDSIRTGNDGPGTVTAVFSFATSADSMGKLTAVGGTRPPGLKAAAGVFSSGASSKTGFLRVANDTDLRLAAGGWTQMVWAKGLSPGNPGIGKTQVVFAVYETPDQLRVGFNQLGYVFAVLTDDANSSVDSVSVVADLYDSSWHLITTRLTNNTLRLKIDNQAEVTTAITNASSALTTDTLDIFGLRASSLFRGHVDELWLAEDSTWVNPELREYAYRAWLADTAWVHVTGLGTDSARVDTAVKVAPLSPTVTSRKWHAFETAFLDSDETRPILVYTGATSPKVSLLDSIPANLLQYPIGHLLTGKRRPDYALESVTFQHEAAKDTSMWELRVYNSGEDTRDMSKGYFLAASARLHTNYPSVTYDLGDLTVGPYMFVTVHAKGSAATTGNAILRGRRK